MESGGCGVGRGLSTGVHRNDECEAVAMSMRAAVLDSAGSAAQPRPRGASHPSIQSTPCGGGAVRGVRPIEMCPSQSATLTHSVCFKAAGR